MDNYSILKNTSSEEGRDMEDEMYHGFYAPVDVPLIIMWFLIIAANSLVVILVYWKQSLRSLSNTFLASMAISDSVSSTFGIPFLISCSATTSKTACVPSVIFLKFGAVSTVLHLLIIAFDRYAMIVHPLRYSSLITVPKAVAAVLCTYFTSVAVALVQLSWTNVETLDVEEDAEDTILEIEKLFFISCLAVFFAVPITLMCYFYGHVFAISLRHKRDIRRQHGQRLPRSIGEFRGSLVLCAMLVVFILCWFPYFALGLQHNMGDEPFSLPIWFEHSVVFLRFTAPLVNPVLTTICKQDFRRALRLWIKMIQRHCVNCFTVKKKYQPRFRPVYSAEPEGPRVVFEHPTDDARDKTVVSEVSNYSKKL